MEIRRLQPTDLRHMKALLDVFGAAFDEPATYDEHRPGDAYLATLLGRDHFITLVALDRGRVVGGLAAYELQKFEQERSEIFIYDLAVEKASRRKGVATALINALRTAAAEAGVHVVFVQADRGDEPAIALYEKLGVREEVLHFDIPAIGVRDGAPGCD